MFDTTIIRPVSGDKYVTVTEKRAPTDDSVRLLREMEAAAQNKLIEAINVEGNGFNCVVQLYCDVASDKLIAKAVFDLNGKRFTEDVAVDRSEADPDKVFSKLREQVATAVARTILHGAFSLAACRATPSAFSRPGGP